MGALPRVLESSLKCKEKGVKKKYQDKKNRLSNLQNVVFFFPLFGPLLLSNLITFLFFIHFKQFKVL